MGCIITQGGVVPYPEETTGNQDRDENKSQLGYAFLPNSPNEKSLCLLADSSKLAVSRQLAKPYQHKLYADKTIFIIVVKGRILTHRIGPSMGKNRNKKQSVKRDAALGIDGFHIPHFKPRQGPSLEGLRSLSC